MFILVVRVNLDLKGIRIKPRRVRAPALARNNKKTSPKIIFDNPRSSIKPGSARDPKYPLLSDLRTDPKCWKASLIDKKKSMTHRIDPHLVLVRDGYLLQDGLANVGFPGAA